jgi:hypothetical protein
MHNSERYCNAGLTPLPFAYPQDGMAVLCMHITSHLPLLLLAPLHCASGRTRAAR